MAQQKRSAVRSSKGAPGGLRASLRPTAVGLASALASASLAQEPAPPPTQPPAASSPAVTASPVPGTPEKEPVATPQVPAPAEPEAAPAATAQTPPPAGESADTGDAQFTLPTVDVQAEAEAYKPEESALTRLPTALIDTPQQVVVVPQAVIRDQNATSLRDALRNVSGITVAAGEGGAQGDRFFIRGFSAQTDTYRDGVRDLGWFTRDTFNLGSVETYLGPSAVLFGRGSTGGAINLVTQKPGRQAFQDVRLSGGSAPSGRLEVDINQPINDRTGVRLIAVGQLAEVAGRDQAERNRAAVAPSVRVKLTDRTSVELDYLYQREDNVPDYGHTYLNGEPLTSAGVARETYYGVPGSDEERVNANIATAKLIYTLTENAVVTNTLRFGKVNRFARTTSARGVVLSEDGSTGTIGRQRFEIETDNTYLINQTDVRMSFLTAFLEHSVNAGIELARENREQFRDNLNAVGLPGGANLPADLFNPDPNPDLSPVQRVFNNANETEQGTLAVYAADQIKITRYLDVLASARFDVFRTVYQIKNAAGAIANDRQTDNIFNWRLGLVGHPIEDTSIYAMVGTSANPSAELGTFPTGTVGGDLGPERNQTYELGAKADLFEGRLGLSGAAFRIDKLNARVPDPENPAGLLRLEGEQRVQGVNVGLAGRIVERWQTMLSYTFMHSEIVEHSNDFLEGQQLPNTPQHSASLWTTYEPIDGLSLGGGVTYQSDAVANNPASDTVLLNKVPSYWRVDAFARYAISPRSDVQLNLNNLTNALYYEQYSGGNAVPADGFNAFLTFGMRF